MKLLKSLMEWTDEKLNSEDHLHNYEHSSDIEDKINHFNGLTTDEVDPDRTRYFPHISEYTDERSTDLNTDLWRIKNGYLPAPDAVENAKNLSHELNEFPTYHENLTVYSGLSRKHIADKLNQGIVHMPSFLSASLSPNVAHQFATKFGDSKEGDILRVHIKPMEKHGAFIEAASQKVHESEYLFHPNKVLKIKSKPSQSLKDQDGRKIRVWDAHVMSEKEMEKHLDHPEIQSYYKMKDILK